MAMTLDNLQTHVYIIYGAFGGMYFLLFCVVLYLMVAVARLNKKFKNLNQSEGGGGGHSGHVGGGGYHQADELRQRGYATYDGNRQSGAYPPSNGGPISPPGRMSQHGGSQGYDNRAFDYEQQQQKKAEDQKRNDKMLKMGQKFGGKLAKKGFKEFNEDNDLF